MAERTKLDLQPDWKGIAQAQRFHIPSDELDEAAAILGPLVEDCRDAFDEDLGLLEPIGSFRPDRA